MSGPTLIAPNTANLMIGKGICSFKKTGGADYVDLGNVTEVVLTPDLTTLEHFTSRAGVKQKDLTVVLEKKSSLKFVMEEFTPHNVGLMLLGAVDEAAVGGPEVDIFSESLVTGAFKFVGTNDIGPKWTMDLYNISILPSGDFGLITDEWGNMEITADVLASTEAPNIGKFGIIKLTNLDTTT